MTGAVMGILIAAAVVVIGYGCLLMASITEMSLETGQWGGAAVYAFLISLPLGAITLVWVYLFG